MAHPATVHAVTTTVQALQVPLDMGFVFPPRPGEDRGRGVWQRRDLGLTDILQLLPRAAAANARGGNVYIRARESEAGHFGLILLDDLTPDATEQLRQDGFPPTLVVETSNQNFQAWIRLAPSRTLLDRHLIHAAIRHLVRRYGADPRATSPVQPGRLPGFTNRKAKHRLANGQYPFVRIRVAAPLAVAPAAAALLAACSAEISKAQRGRAPGRAPEIVPSATASSSEAWALLDQLRVEAQGRILRQMTAGTRPASAASRSEIDFAVVSEAIKRGIAPEEVTAWLAAHRPDKGPTYPDRTWSAATAWLGKSASFERFRP